MKVIAIVALGLLLSNAAIAASANYKASAPRISMGVKSKASDVKMCPVLDLVTIVTKTGSLEAKSIVLASGKSQVVAKSSGATLTCHSDIVCPTEDNFMLDKNTMASAERNNNGDYPTTDIAGHNHLSIDGPSLIGRDVYCNYDLIPAK